MDFSKIDFQQYIVDFGLKVFIAIAIFIVGWWIIKLIMKALSRVLKKTITDDTIRPLVISTLSLLLKIILLIIIASTVGIETTSFVAVLGALSLAAGLAFQGSLGNLAGGLLLLTFRPFNVGDYIKAQGHEGFVKAIQLFTTILETPDKKTIYLPNGAVSSNNIENISQAGELRLHIPVGISYDADIKKARNVIMDVMNADKMVLKSPEPSVAVVNLGDSSVDLDVRPWCKPIDSPTLTVTLLENIKIALDKNDIEIPYPHSILISKN